jgi:hypothetical protein
MMVELEFFRTQHRHREVSEQGEGDEPDEDGFHGGGWLERFAAFGVKPADDEEGGGDAEVEEVVHDDIPCLETHDV